MISPHSWKEDYFGAEQIERVVVLPPFYVEFRTGEGWELWAECEDEELMEFEVDLLKQRYFDYRVRDSRGEELQV